MLRSGAGDRDRTGTLLPAPDFKSEASANSATSANTNGIIARGREKVNARIKGNHKEQEQKRKYGIGKLAFRIFWRLIPPTCTIEPEDKLSKTGNRSGIKNTKKKYKTESIFKQNPIPMERKSRCQVGILSEKQESA